MTKTLNKINLKLLFAIALSIMESVLEWIERYESRFKFN